MKDDKIGSFVSKGRIPALNITATDEELKRAALRAAFVPIVDDRGVFVGVVDREDIVQYFADKAKTAPVMVTA